MKKQLFAVLVLSSVLFAETQLGKETLNELKKLKPLNNKDVVITEGVEKDSLYVLKLKVKDVRGTKIVPANVTKDKKYVIIGTAYESDTGNALGVTDMRKFNSDAAFSIGDAKYGGEFYVFTDPDCPICKTLEKQLRNEGLMKYAKMNIFFFPIDSLHPDSRRKCEYILSLPAEDRVAAYRKLSSGDKKWKEYTPSQEIKQKMAVSNLIAKDLGVRGTPSFFDSSGNEISPRVFVAYLRAIKKKAEFKEKQKQKSRALHNDIVTKDSK
jgi:protein-disulfide isomerase